MTLAYIAIGSNLASPLEQVNAAVQALGEIPQSRIVAVSSFYRTPPLGPQDQPDYLNAAVVLDTALDALDALNATGKTIGVISHVEAMKERIPVQIKVKKINGLGYSRLDKEFAVQ